MMIKDIKRVHLVEETDEEQEELDDLQEAYQSPKEQFAYEDLKNKLFEGLNQDAHKVKTDQQNIMTRQEFGLSDKQIIVPSFGTTSQLFQQHFAILRNLRHKITLLKNAYELQKSDERSWEQIELILKAIDYACEFLDFPENFDEMVEEAWENDKKMKEKQEKEDKLKKPQVVETKKQKNPSPFGDFGFGLGSAQKS